MPTYAYACTACSHTFDIRQSFTDDALTVCPECSGKLRKVFSPVGVTFKGSGFYRTDSRSGSSRTGSSAPKPAGEKASSSTSTADSSGSGGASAGDSSGSTSGGAKTTTKATSGSATS